MIQPPLFNSQQNIPDILMFENAAFCSGYRHIAGIDEAGRGPLAGPVTAAAVILPRGIIIEGVTDSKKLSATAREQFYTRIVSEAVSIGIGIVEAEVIDQINILQATRRAMLQAVEQLKPQPDCLLIDGISTIHTPLFQKTIKKGDSLSHSIAAASIIAKVTRDRLMIELDAQYPGYGFAQHKGYGSKTHLQAIRMLGPSPVHRLTFGGVKEYAGCLHS